MTELFCSSSPSGCKDTLAVYKINDDYIGLYIRPTVLDLLQVFRQVNLNINYHQPEHKKAGHRNGNSFLGYLLMKRFEGISS